MESTFHLLRAMKGDVSKQGADAQLSQLMTVMGVPGSSSEPPATRPPTVNPPPYRFIVPMDVNRLVAMYASTSMSSQQQRTSIPRGHKAYPAKFTLLNMWLQLHCLRRAETQRKVRVMPVVLSTVKFLDCVGWEKLD